MVQDTQLTGPSRSENQQENILIRRQAKTAKGKNVLILGRRWPDMRCSSGKAQWTSQLAETGECWNVTPLVLRRIMLLGGLRCTFPPQLRAALDQASAMEAETPR